MNIKKKAWRRFSALFLMLSLLVMNCGSIIAEAASIASMESLGTLSSSNPYGIELDVFDIKLSHNGTTYRAFCIEPNSTMKRGNTYTQDQADSYWTKTMSQNQRDAIGLILYYGYYGSGHQTDAYLAATQMLIWEVTGFNRSYKTVAPLRTFNFESCTTSCSKSLLDYYIKSTL